MKRFDYFTNIQGLNTTDSPFMVQDGQATDGYNYDYLRTGGITKRRGHILLNSSPFSSVYTLGQGVHQPASGTKTLLRAADRNLQTVDLTANSVTNVTDDTSVASTNIFALSSTQPVVFSPFNTSFTGLTPFAGGGAASVMGYTGTVVTKNGSDISTGTLTGSAGGSGGAFGSTGYYTYAVAMRKVTTQALSNAALDVVINVTATTQEVTLTLPVGNDTTKYDQFYIYRSAGTVSSTGSSGFTSGDLIAKIASTSVTYVDDGTSIVSTTPVPRGNSLALDNSVLPSGTYNTLTTFKRRLVTASGSTLYLSDLDKPESWPVGNTISLPTAGPITGLAVIGYNAFFSGTTDEYLVIFKDRELWVLTGTNSSTWELKFIDVVGCAAQRLIVSANGYITWIDYRGVYMWAGSGKPIYISRPIESLFSYDGDLDKTNLPLGWGRFFRKQNQVIWFLSHRTKGIQKFVLKLDIRLTVPKATEGLDQKLMEGVFSQDNTQFPLYGGESFIPSGDSEEQFFSGDISGNLYKLYFGVGDADGTLQFSYVTRDLDQQNPAVAKRYFSLVVYVDELGSWNLNVDFWSNYKILDSDKSTQSQPVSKSNMIDAALWDLAYWDVAYWDQYKSKIRKLTYNLSPHGGNTEGDSIKLKFYNLNSSEPITIHGFSLFYDEIEVRKS